MQIQKVAVLVVGFLVPLFFMFTGCSESPPVRIGLVAGLSGGNADLGQAGRNGVLLAVEQINKQGGINQKHKIELVIRDDGNDRGKAAAAADSLVQEGVSVIIGPYTTAMCEAVLQVAQPKDVLVVSPTASAASLSGRDDVFFRMNSSTADNAQSYARYMIGKLGYRRVTLVIDQQNATFAQDWIDAYEQLARALGVESIHKVWYSSGNISSFPELLNQISTGKPEVALFVANAVDVARIAQQLRKTNQHISLFAVEWAGTQQLIELGGQAVDGLEVLHMFNMFGSGQAYLDFVDAYSKRFNSTPSFSSILSYEVVQVLAQAMTKREKTQDLKMAILENGPYQGLQQKVEWDRFGDSHRQTFFVRIDKTKFVPTGNQ